MRPHSPLPPVPADTMRAAKAVYSQSNLYLSMGDRLALLLADIHFSSSNSLEAHYHRGRPLLALVTFFQYLEKLSDSQAAEATNARTDWKYALHLSMNYPGISPSALCDFRQSILRQPDQRVVFQMFLDRLWEGSGIAEIEGKPIDALRVINEVCVRTRLERVMLSMRNALQALATCCPEWLLRTSQPYWYTRYEAASYPTTLTRSMEQQIALAESTGGDIIYLLEAIASSGYPEMEAKNEVQELHKAWREHFDPICVNGVKMYAYCYYCGNAQPEVPMT